MFESFLGVNPWTALFILLNTLTIFFVAQKYLFRPVMKIIEDRQQEIDDMYVDAGEAQMNAQALEAEYREKLSAAAQTGERIVKEAVARGQLRQEQIIRTAREEAGAIMDKAAAEINREKKRAIDDARNEISGIAIAIAAKVVGRELNSADQGRLIDSFIQELGDQS